MKATRFICYLVIFTFLLGVSAEAIYYGETTKSHEDAQPLGLIIKFKQETKLTLTRDVKGQLKTGLSVVDQINERHNIKHFESLIKIDEMSALDHPFKQVFVLEADKTTDLEALKSNYEALSAVEYVEFDYPLELFGTGDPFGRDDPPPPPPDPIPNDPYYDLQWHLNNTGQQHPHVLRNDNCYNDVLIYVGGISGADIKADTVFQNPPDQTEVVVVAIIDTGVDSDHPELSVKMWSNYREHGTNGIDDDNNGYIDDKYGWDFSGCDTLIHVEDNDPADEHGHGTHCAGIVTAVSDNDLGIAGICPDVEIMPLKIFPWAIMSKLARAIIYAADNNADVVNMSLGAPYSSAVLDDAVVYAKDKGVILCASMGNSGENEGFYPAIYDETIAIGASNDSDHVTTWSTFGNHVNVVAPGQSILSLRAAGTDMYAGYCEPDVHIFDSIYYMASGTSMSCPAVVGVAAYLKAVSPGIKPDVAQQILEQTADDYIDPYGYGSNLPGWDMYSGHGRVNLFQALQNAPGVRAKLDFPKPHETLGGFVIVTGIADGPDFESYTVEYGAGANPTSWTGIATSTTPVSDNQLLTTWITGGLIGQYTIRLRVSDDNMDMVTFYLNPGQVAEITTPATGDTLVNEIDVIGSSYSVSYDHYILEYRPVEDTTESWEELIFCSIPKYDEVLATWYTSDLPVGDYLLRLRTFWVSGEVAADTVEVFIDPFLVSDNWTVNLGATGAQFPTYADLDGDTHFELIVGTLSGIKFYNIGGTEKTVGVPSVPPGDYRMTMAIGNLDGDGTDDFVTINYDSSMIFGSRSTGGTFVIPLDFSPYIIHNPSNTSEKTTPYIILKDIDNDNIDEMIVRMYIKKWFGNGYRVYSSTFIVEITDTDIGLSDTWGYYHIHAADLENDGYYSLFALDTIQWSLYELDIFGTPIDSFDMNMNGEGFSCYTLTSYDIDSDDKLELILMGKYPTYGHHIYAFDEGLSIKDGWPHDMSMDWFWAGTGPVFGDIDNDGELEYISSYYDLTNSFILVWNIDGSSYIPGNNGLLTQLPFPTMVNYQTLADLNDDGWIDIVSIAQRDLFFTNPGEWLFAWDHNGMILDGFPITLNPDAISSLRNMPIIGDMSQDGNVDLALVTSQAELVFMNFTGYAFNDCKSPATCWRYHRNLDGIGPSFIGDCDLYICGDVNRDQVIDTLDINYLIAYMFYGGPAPDPMESGNVDCVPGIDIGDLTYLIQYVLYGGSAPCDCEGGGAKVNGFVVTFEAVYEDGFTYVTMSSPVDLAGLQIEFEGNIESIPVNISNENLDLLFDKNKDDLKIGLLDLDGDKTIPSGEQSLIRIKGEHSIQSVIAVGANNNNVTARVVGSGLKPDKFALYQNHPNPFNPITVIEAYLPFATDYSLTIYNISGQKVKEFKGHGDAGIIKFDWNASDYASGVYFYRFNAGEFTESKKMILLK